MNPEGVSMRGRLLVWGLLAVAAAGTVFAVSSRGAPEARQAVAASPAPDRSGTHLTMEACAQAQRAVKSQLKAPASAKFPGCAMGAHEYKITTNEARDKFAVRGHVDSQNSFGAMIRSEFGVILDYSDGNWTATRVAIE